MIQTFHRLSMLIVALLASMVTFATAFTVDGITYDILDKDAKTLEVVAGSSKYAGNIVIPESVTIKSTSYSVASIGDNAFYKCSGLISVIIPNSVKTIGNFAFYYCSGLTSVTIGNSVTSIGNNAFYYCSSLTSVTIPNSVKTIGGAAFYYCSGLTSVTIGNSVTSIGDSSFYNCFGLTSVTIGNSVTSIGDCAFQNCTGLTSVNITDIAAWCNISFRSSTANPLCHAHHLYLNEEEIKDFVIPNSVTIINSYAFFGYTGLTSITIPNSVTTIGDYAFDGCEGLRSVIIPNSVTRIWNAAFQNCSGLTSVTIGNSVTSIGIATFRNCSSLTSVTIPNSVTSIDQYAFYNCSGLTSVTIPNSVTSIDCCVFSGCSGLKSVTIPNSVTSIGSEAFYGCKNIENVYCYAENVPSTGTDVFKDAYTEYATLYIPEASIGAYKATDPWSNFGTFKALESGQEPATPDTCATPTISVVNGKLHFECETEGAGFHYTVTPNGTKASGAYAEEDVEIVSPSYIVACYATADGYVQSETATVEITLGGYADVNADGKVDISDVNKVVSVICGGE